MKTTRMFPCNVDSASVIGVAMLAVAFSVVLPSGADDAFASASSDSLISIDLRKNVCRAVSPVEISYSPKWSGIDDSGCYVVLQKVEYASSENAITNTLATFPAGEESSFTYVVNDGDERCVRFLHRTYFASGVVASEPMVRDVSFGFRSGTSEVFSADSRTNSLQVVVDAGVPADLTYDIKWIQDAVSATIDAIRTVVPRGHGSISVTTNTLLTEADGVGSLPLPKFAGGNWRLVCTLKDAQEKVVGEPMEAQFSCPMIYGSMFLIR